MIQYVDAPARTVPQTPPPVASVPLRVSAVLHGPGRAADPEEAFAADMAEIVATKGYADEGDFVRLGWLVNEIVEYLPTAIRRARGCDDEAIR